MKTQFISKLLTTNWNLSPARARAFLATLLPRLRSERPAEDICGEPLPKMTVSGDIAIIPITGVLMMRVPQWLKEWGCNITDADDIADEVAEALNDPRVAMIVPVFDSPGGWSIAGDKLFEIFQAANARKPVFAFCPDGADMCSSAYEAAAPSRMIMTGRFACVGAIGTYLVALDDTEFWKMLGITVEVFRSGELKGMGEDGFSEAQKKFLQSQVDEYGARFRSNVARYRTQLPIEEMQGQYYDGHEAALRGFTHGTAPDLTAAVTRFRSMI